MDAVTPAYNIYMTGLLKNFTDRFLPLAGDCCQSCSFQVEVENCRGAFQNQTMIKRDIETELVNLSTQYPVVTVTGPRQAGKLPWYGWFLLITTTATLNFPI